jgi:hypothetical protein
VSRRAFFGFGYRFRGNIRVGPEFSTGQNDYENAFFPSEVPTLRQDDLLSGNIGVRFPVARSFEWEIKVGYSERDSNLSGLSDEGITVFSDISYRFDQ